MMMCGFASFIHFILFLYMDIRYFTDVTLPYKSNFESAFVDVQ